MLLAGTAAVTHHTPSLMQLVLFFLQPRHHFMHITHGNIIVALKPCCGCLYACRHGHDHLLLELEFPDDYPASPFFARLIKPRAATTTAAAE
jgi:hypothetical protein